MASAEPVGDVHAAILNRLYSSVTVWNRVEGRPRTRSFERALSAEVRDPLWLLAKQWQLGEFEGSDAGSPTFAKVSLQTTRLTKYQPAGEPVEAFEYDLPASTKVEQRPVPILRGGQAASLDLRLAMGRQWLRLTAGIDGGHRADFIDAYPVIAPDPSDPGDAWTVAHPHAWQLAAATAGRAMDGGSLYLHLSASSANHSWDGIATIASTHQPALLAAETRFLAWFARVLQQPGSDEGAWVPERLTYQFSTSAPLPSGEEKVYVADSYHQTELDWFSVDVDPAVPALDLVAGSTITGLPVDGPRSMIPIPVSFAGMPNTRWWAFEDRKTNYGDIDASTTDLAKVMFLEFALVYSNDWFVIPYTLPLGSIATVRGVVVTDTFGERFWVGAAGSGPDDDWQRWSMFTINSVVAGEAADNSLLLMPTTSKVQDGPPIEDVWMIRDEVANMVWGVERVVPMITGDTAPGLEAAKQTRAFYEAQLAALIAGGGGAAPLVAAADKRYEVMTSVPENWVPFIPVHVPGSNREIQLQRAALPRTLEGDPAPAVKVQPRTGLVRTGLDASPPQTYLVHEEEVPRAGTRLFQSYQRTRWTDGTPYTWLRVQRQTGRGEGSSGLAFDQLIDVPPTS